MFVHLFLFALSRNFSSDESGHRSLIYIQHFLLHGNICKAKFVWNSGENVFLFPTCHTHIWNTFGERVSFSSVTQAAAGGSLKGYKTELRRVDLRASWVSRPTEFGPRLCYLIVGKVIPSLKNSAVSFAVKWKGYYDHFIELYLDKQMSSVIIFTISITCEPQIIDVQRIPEENPSITTSSLKNLSWKMWNYMKSLLQMKKTPFTFVCLVEMGNSVIHYIYLKQEASVVDFRV